MWLKLTAKFEKEKFFYVNTEKMTRMEELTDGGTLIDFESPEMWLKVKETPEEILQIGQTFTMYNGVK